MSSASVASPPRIMADDCVVLPHVSWETYERLISDDEERRIPRMTYDQGVLELATPSMPHEEDARTIASLVEIVTANLGIAIRSVGSTTYRRRDLERGFEPDASFYVQNEERIRGLREVDLAVNPPPDVVLEMEMSRSALDKLGLFASMGIPEVWRCDGQRVSIFILDRERGSYRESPSSLALPALTSEVLTRFLAYCRYAVEQPGSYQLLFNTPRPDIKASDFTGTSGAAAFQTLVDGVPACIAAGVARPGDPFRIATDIWSALHGTASLRRATTSFPWPPLEDQVRVILEAFTGIPYGVHSTSEETAHDGAA